MIASGIIAATIVFMAVSSLRFYRRGTPRPRSRPGRWFDYALFAGIVVPAVGMGILAAYDPARLAYDQVSKSFLRVLCCCAAVPPGVTICVGCEVAFDRAGYPPGARLLAAFAAVMAAWTAVLLPLVLL